MPASLFYRPLFPALLFLLVLFSCRRETSLPGAKATQSMAIHFKPVVGQQRLQFGATYTNAAGEPFSVQAFKFYISEIDLINERQHQTYKVDREQYFLVNFSDSASTTLSIEVKPGTYDHIAFVVGVDSSHNVSGAQTGALDPANGMFWTWNSGYIMAKLEGTTPVSQLPNQVFQYHIGGFAGSNSVVQKISLSSPADKAIEVSDGKSGTITITADVNKWFSGVHPISLATVPVCMTPGLLSKTIADNYLQMFTIEDVVNP